MQITPDLSLFIDENQTPDYYWVDVTIPDPHNYEIVSYGEITEDTQNNTFYVDVNIQPLVDGEKTMEVLLGDLNAGSTHKTVHVNLVDDTDSDSGTGTVSTETAQQESRPISGEQLPD